MLHAPPPPFVQSVQMATADVGYLVGGRETSTRLRLYRTQDGGRDWRDVTPGDVAAPPTAVGASGVYVPVRLHGAIVVERSTDGGATWLASRPIRDARPAGPGQVQPLGARLLYLALGEGAAAGSSAQSLWRSGDGGVTWQLVSRTQLQPDGTGLPFSCDKNGVGFATPSRGWAGGDCAGGPAFFYRTDDGGRTWRRLPLAGLGACACDVSSPRFSNARDGAFGVTGFPQAGPGPAVARVYWTRDGGRRWRATRPPAGRLGVVDVVDGRTAWVTGSRRGSIRLPLDRLFRTTDAGRSWQVTRLPLAGQVSTIDAVDATVAFATTEHAVLRTGDGGRTWRRVG